MAQPATPLNEPVAAGGAAGPPFRPAAWHSRLLDVLLPPQCLGCACLVETAGTLCAECWERATFLGPPQCRACGLPFEIDPGDGAVCGACHRTAPIYDRARAALIYDEVSRPIVLALKYADRTDTAPALGRWLAAAGKDLLAEADLVAPVPLHWTRLFGRRFNQAALLAQWVVRGGGNDHHAAYAPDVLVRRRRTDPQAGKGPRQRHRNVAGAFAINSAWRTRLSGRKVLLIDDVMTTGATVSACAKILKSGGAASVDVLTLARVVRPRVE